MKKKDAHHGSDTPATLEELRAGIDVLDMQIVDLLGKRARLVRCLAGLKKKDGTRDLTREGDVLLKVKEAATQKGLDQDVIEEIYRILFNYFVNIQEEKRT